MKKVDILQRYRLLRRVNLGNYEHYEMEILIHDTDETKAMNRALKLYKKTCEALSIRERVDIRKI